MQQIHVSLILLAAAMPALAVSAWSRWGTGRRAQWWVRSVTLDDPRKFAFIGREATGLTIIPFLGLQFLNFGIGAFPPISDRIFGYTLLMLFALSFALGISMRAWVLPTWLYPRRLRALREERREELRLLRSLRGGRVANYFGARSPAYNLRVDWDAFALARSAHEPTTPHRRADGPDLGNVRA